VNTRTLYERAEELLKPIKKYKVLISIGVAFFLLFISSNYIKPYFIYTINDNEQAIKESISKLLEQPIQINMVKDIDNKRIVLFTLGTETGESELTKGPNKKYKIDSAGHGSNTVRYRIMETNKDQYVRFLGMNEDNISKILVFIEGERYNLSVPEGQYFITYIPLSKQTESKFPSGSVWFDKDNKEIIRINISKDYIL
jgi:hypothetical protein